jgi:hypothetical protein
MSVYSVLTLADGFRERNTISSYPQIMKISTGTSFPLSRKKAGVNKGSVQAELIETTWGL